MAEVLVYGNINDYSAELVVQAINAIPEGEDLILRVNSNGGEVMAGWSIIQKFSEFQGKKILKIDGKAFSMAACLALYADEVECIDVSRFMFHRASYGEWYEKSEYFTETDRKNLESVNKSLKQAITNVVNVEKFEEIAGVTLNEIFSLENRIDVYLTAQDAKKIGLVSKIYKLTPDKVKEINSMVAKVAASSLGDDLFVDVINEEQSIDSKVESVLNNKKQSKMTVAELKAQHPDLYAQIVGEGVTQERDRVSAWMVFSDTDQAKVKAGVESGSILSQKDMAEFTLQHSKNTLKATLEDEAAKDGAEANAKIESKKDDDSKEEKDPVADLTAAILGKEVK